VLLGFNANIKYEEIKRLMTEQYSSMIEELLAGRYTEQFRPGNIGDRS
jgi:hypothetical protein